MASFASLRAAFLRFGNGVFTRKNFAKNFPKNIYRKMLDKLWRKLLLFYNVILCVFIGFCRPNAAS